MDMSGRKSVWKQDARAPLALLKSALLELLKIDTIIPDEDFKNMLHALVGVFFEGKIYLAYDPITGHLGFVTKRGWPQYRALRDANIDKESASLFNN